MSLVFRFFESPALAGFLFFLGLVLFWLTPGMFRHRKHQISPGQLRNLQLAEELKAAKH